MKISIITICLNSEKTILDTLNSVINQNYENIEHIIVDGGSKDKTKTFLRKYIFKNKRIFSFKKKGIYNAINYGIKKATGDIIHILHSDDIYQSNQTISDIINKIKNRKEKIFLSDIVFFKNNDFSTISRFYSASEFKINKLKYAIMPPHPGLFVRKEIYKKFLYSKNYKIAGDFDFFIKILLINKINFFYINLISVRMRMGGISSRNINAYITSTIEILKIFKSHNITSGIFHALARIPSKIYQLFFYNQTYLNKNFQLKISSFYKSFLNYDFIIKKNINSLDFKENFIFSAMNLAFLGSYAKGDIIKKKYLINWPDGLFSKKICDLNIKIPGREIIRSLKIPKIIKKITVIGNLSYNSKFFLEKLLKINVKNINLPYGDIKTILKNFKYKTFGDELIFITLPTPKQELLANYIADKNKKFKIICIGGSIAIAAGDEKEVPKFLYSLEFLWRLRYETNRRILRLLNSYLYYLIGRFFNNKLKKLKIIYESY
jgi:glycosyltransferase involved in cell wall biosynthesis